MQLLLIQNNTITMVDTTTVISCNEHAKLIDSSNTRMNNDKDDTLSSGPKLFLSVILNLRQNTN